MHGLGPKRTQRIADAWEEQKAIKEVMVFLSDVGVSTSLAVRIYKRYADESIPVVRSEPYRLASEVWGIGFKTADTIAQAVGIPHDSPERIKAGLQYTLSEASDNGNCYLPEPDLIREATKILAVDPLQIGPCLDQLAAEEGVIRERVQTSRDHSGSSVPAVYLLPFHRAERSLAGGILDLPGGGSGNQAVDTVGAGRIHLVRRRGGLVAAKNVDTVHLGACQAHQLFQYAFHLVPERGLLLRRSGGIGALLGQRADVIEKLDGRLDRGVGGGHFGFHQIQVLIDLVDASEIAAGLKKIAQHGRIVGGLLDSIPGRELLRYLIQALLYEVHVIHELLVGRIEYVHHRISLLHHIDESLSQLVDHGDHFARSLVCSL